jgi:SAM-dependent methyltransferase
MGCSNLMPVGLWGRSMPSGPDSYLCSSCGTVLTDAFSGSYAGCSSCGSYVYCSSRSAEEDNRTYFDAVYREISNYVVDPHKQRIFEAWRRRDQETNRETYDALEGLRAEINRLIFSAGVRVLEIGFGGGNLLAALLTSGADAWGEELSATSLENFKAEYPAWAPRVGRPGSVPGDFDFIYCSALFEHLDDPLSFLTAASTRLTGKGRIVLDNFPLVVKGLADTTPANDICFWKPCHRLLCTVKGLQHIVAASGLRLESLAMHDSYLYRVLSLHRLQGYSLIETMRNPCLRHADFPGWVRFWLICRRALRLQSCCHLASAVLIKSDNMY